MERNTGCFFFIVVAIILMAMFFAPPSHKLRDDIRQQGADAAAAGLPPDANPYATGWHGDPNSHQYWQEGWNAEMQERSRK